MVDISTVPHEPLEAKSPFELRINLGKDVPEADVRSARSDEPSETQDLAGNANNIYIQYSVFAPVTAKTTTQGNTYPNAYRRGINLPTTTTGGDYYLNQAARGAAERILDHFHVPLHR